MTLRLTPTAVTTSPWRPRSYTLLSLKTREREKLLQQELMLDHAFHDKIEQYDKQEVLTAMKKELDKLQQKDMYEECDKSTLTPEQLRKVVKTCWVVGDRQILLRLQLLEKFTQANYEHVLLPKATANRRPYG